jgi:aminocarboxymuconate-semialdehyde decarboxylase
VNIDLHSHFFPLDAFQKAEKYSQSAPKFVLENGQYSVASRGGSRGNLSQGAYDVEARIRDLDEMRIDLQALSPSPVLLFYWDEPDSAAYFSRLQNEAIQRVVKAYPRRFVGFGTVPLQSIPHAIAIAEEAKKLGLKGLEIGTSVEGKPLDEAEFAPFYEAAQRLDLLLFVHPIEGEAVEREDAIGGMLGNALGFPYKTTVMIERMILKGIFEKYPNLRLCLAHGGGLLPYNIWRLDHAYSQRIQLRKNIPREPSQYLRQMLFDSIVHSPLALKFLIQVVGSDRVVIGTDYPMGMGDREAVSRIMSVNSISAEQRAQILGTNATAALRMDRATNAAS